MPERPSGSTSFSLSTAPRSNSHAATAAIAIFDIVGDPEPFRAMLDGGRLPEPAQIRLVSIPAIDEVLVCRISQTHIQVHAHAGPFNTRKLAERLLECGIVYQEPRPSDARDLLIYWLANAPSPRAIDLLLAQSIVDHGGAGKADPRLDRLLRPPLVVAIGRPNAGKSSLLNALAKRSVAVVSDLAGTTRDSVGATLELDGLAVRWLDLPGIRETKDPIEAQAVERSLQWVGKADLVVSCAPWGQFARPEGGAAGLTVQTKCDLPPGSQNPTFVSDISCSAHTGEGLAELAMAVRRELVPDEILDPAGRWDLPVPSDSETNE